MRHPNEWPKPQSAVLAARIRALEILRHFKSKLSIWRSFVAWAFCGRHTNANVGNIRKGVKEGIHFVDYILAGSFTVPAIRNDSSAILRSGKRFVVRADEKLTAFVELECQTRINRLAALRGNVA
jgi:hypothetical protein